MGATEKIILGAILMLLGAVLIGVIATETAKVTDFLDVKAEQHAMTATADAKSVNDTAVYTITNYPQQWRSGGGCPISSIAIKNQSGSALTLTTDYTVDATAGTYQLVNSSTANAILLTGPAGKDNNTYVDYSYCGENYLNTSMGRSILNMSIGLIAVLLLAAAVGIFYSVYQEVKER